MRLNFNLHAWLSKGECNIGFAQASQTGVVQVHLGTMTNEASGNGYSMRTRFTLILVALSLMSFTAQLRALRIILPTTSKVLFRATKSSHIVVGKVLRIEPQPALVPQYPGGSGVKHSVAIIKVEKSILNPLELTHLRVGFIPSGHAQNGYSNLDLTQEQTVLLYLRSFPNQTILTPVDEYSVVGAKHNKYKDEISQAKKYGPLLQNPMKLLQDKDAKIRAKTAVLLIQRYRLKGNSHVKEVPISLEESRLILAGLMSVDWNSPAMVEGVKTQSLFQQLGLGPTDGWNQPNEKAGTFPIVVQDWLKKHKDSYRIKKWIRAKPDFFKGSYPSFSGMPIRRR